MFLTSISVVFLFVFFHVVVFLSSFQTLHSLAHIHFSSFASCCCCCCCCHRSIICVYAIFSLLLLLVFLYRFPYLCADFFLTFRLHTFWVCVWLDVWVCRWSVLLNLCRVHFIWRLYNMHTHKIVQYTYHFFAYLFMYMYKYRRLSQFIEHPNANVCVWVCMHSIAFTLWTLFFPLIFVTIYLCVCVLLSIFVCFGFPRTFTFQIQ